MGRRALTTQLIVAITATALCAGCRIDVGLNSSPPTVRIGQPVTFDVTLTNRSTCPVGNVTALLFPFIPKDQRISQISDPVERQALSDAVDAFCTGGNYNPGGMSSCQIVNGELICEAGDTTGDTTGTTQSEMTMLSSEEGDVTCSTDGSQVTCRVPPSIVQMGEQLGASSGGDATAGSLSPVICAAGPNGNLGACFTAKLDVNETKTGQIVIPANESGIVRNWIIAFATKNNGVCKAGAGTKGVPCENSSDCPGAAACGAGLCSGGANDGFGCDTATAGTDCPGGGTCNLCTTTPEEGEVLSGLACTTTDVTGQTAPVMSRWGMAAVVVLLLGVGYAAFRRTRTAAY